MILKRIHCGNTVLPSGPHSGICEAEMPSQPGNLQTQTADQANLQALTGKINAYCYISVILWFLVAHQK